MRGTFATFVAALVLLAACKGNPAAPGASTGTLTVVVMGNGGAAVGSATVLLEPGARTAQTDAQGAARFPDLTAGQYTVTVQSTSGSARQVVTFQPPASEVHLTLTGFAIAENGLNVQWGEPGSLHAVILPPLSGEVVWTSTRDFYLGQPVELGRGAEVSVAPLRPGTTTVEARLIQDGQTVATAMTQVTVNYRVSWNVDLLGQVALPMGSVGDLFVTGRNALVARRGHHGFSVVDVDALQEIGRFDPGAGFAQDVHVSGTRAYVTNEGSEFRHAVTIVDITNPATPVEIGGIPSAVTSSAHTVFVDGATAYLANTPTRQFHIWDVTNPAVPARLATVGATNGYAHEAYVRDGILYGASMQLTTGTQPELTVVNVANPAAPAVLARVVYPNARLVHSVSTSEDGRYLYVADEVTDASIRIFDIGDPAHPVLAGTYQPRLGTVPHHFVVRGQLAYLSSYKNGVEVLDVSDPVRPRLVGFYDTYPGVATDGSTAEPGDVDLYHGAWGVHWTDDGKIVVSDMDAGVFVLRFRG